MCCTDAEEDEKETGFDRGPAAAEPWHFPTMPRRVHEKDMTNLITENTRKPSLR